MSDYQKTVENFDDLCYTKAVKAGRRTYFFDVKATRGDDLFVTITESRKRSLPDGGSTYDRQTMFLYKEDFDKFENGLKEAIDYIKRAKPELFAADGSLIQQDEMSSIDEEFEKL
ncbi:MAG: DUF3276 family protein [Rikenellaceae bacterium]|nr:DUF3276 family protein [Rikenellaceae bacterium]